MSSMPTVLERLLRPGDGNLPRDYARQLLTFEFSPDEQARCQALSEKAQLGTLTVAERGELEEMMVTNDVLALLQAKAKASLDGSADVRS